MAGFTAICCRPKTRWNSARPAFKHCASASRKSSGRSDRAGFSCRSVGQDTVAGHACVIVQVAARSATPVPWRRFWIDPTNGAQLRIEQYDADGQLQSASYYAQVTYSPVFDKGAFRLPHAGSKVVERGFAAPSLTLDQVRAQAGFPVPAPTYLPDGFHFQAGSVSERARPTRD